MQGRVSGCENLATATAISTAPICNHTARALHHRDQGLDIIGLQRALDHQIDPAQRQHGVGIGVIAVTAQAHRLPQTIEGLPFGTLEQERIGSGQNGIGQGCRLPRGNREVVPTP